ncbi:MAG: DMT family transporter [Alphaproteobacteria bacterium]|nr:DMT family transporter [Alphaproteobacteria bacterium]
MQPAAAHYLRGALFGFAAVSIWAGWSAMTRLAVTTSLDAWDIPFLRFGPAGLLLLPIVMRRGIALDRLGWLGLGGLIIGTGAPYALVVAVGLRFAPAYDAGALNPGCMPLFVALIAVIVLRETPSKAQKLGLSLILSGALIIIAWHEGIWSISRGFGDVLFLVGSFLTACYTVIMRRSELDPIHVAALVSCGSLVIYAPIYLTLNGAHLAHLSEVPLTDLTVQVLFQGIVVSIISLVLYGRAVLLLGASGGSAFGALVPALSALLAIPLVGEWPTASGWGGIILISAGVYLASGGPFLILNPRRDHLRFHLSDHSASRDGST